MAPNLPSLFPSVGPVTRWILFGDLDEDLRPPDPEQWAPEMDAVVGQRLAPMALRLVRAQGLGVPAADWAALEAASFDWTTRCLEVTQRSAEALDLLRDVGVPFVVTKGPTLARHYAHRLDRPYGDIDLLVPRGSFTEVLALLGRTLGYREADRNRPAWGAFDLHCREAMNIESPTGGRLDIHHRIPPWRWAGGLTFERLFDRAEPTTTSGVIFPGVAPIHNLFIAALHLVSDRNRPGSSLIIWRDILEVARTCSAFDITREASALGLGGWLRWVTRSLPPPVVPAELSAAVQELNFDLLHLPRLQSMLRSGFLSDPLISQALRLPPGNAALYLAGMVVPSPGFLRAKYPNSSRRYRRWWRSGLGNRHPLAPPVSEP